MGWSWQMRTVKSARRAALVLVALAFAGLAFAGLVAGLGLPLTAIWLAIMPLALFAVLRMTRPAFPPGLLPPGLVPPGLVPPGLACRAMDAVFDDMGSPDPACLILLPDGRAPPSGAALAAALQPVLRTTDMLSLVEGGVAVTLAPLARLDLESMIPIAVRLQRAALALGPVSLGFCLPDQASARSGQALLQSARLAAQEARRHGPGAIRSFRAGMAPHPAPSPRAVLEKALDAGQFIPHFQPQICARTGNLTGAEVLARWHQPAAGLLPPSAFLDDLRHAGLSSRLTMAMLSQTLLQVRRWDAAGLIVPTVALNLDAQDLSDPMLPDLVAWELDRHGLPPHRLTVEVMETVLADGDPVTVRGIDRLARMGCGVDLDDFGTGQAAIGQLRRLTIRRIKIDRSFTAALDSDADQRRVVGAILSMADRLGLDTLAEGVESTAQADVLAAMGCGHLQGWAIAPALSADDFADWLALRASAHALPTSAHAPVTTETARTGKLTAELASGPVTPV